MSTSLYSAFLTQVKGRLRIESSNDLDPFILSWTNEEQHTLARLYNIPDFLVLGAQLTLTNAIGYVNLPTDFLRLNTETVRYYLSGATDSYSTLKKQGNRSARVSGSAYFFRLAQGKIWMIPNSNIATGDYLTIDYYQMPVDIANGSSTIQNSIYDIILDKVAARICRYHDSSDEASFIAASKEKIIALIGSQTD